MIPACRQGWNYSHFTHSEMEGTVLTSQHAVIRKGVIPVLDSEHTLCTGL